MTITYFAHPTTISTGAGFATIGAGELPDGSDVVTLTIGAHEFALTNEDAVRIGTILQEAAGVEFSPAIGGQS